VSNTFAEPQVTEPIKARPIDPPTLAMSFSVNDCPYAGRDGDKVQSRVIRDRLEREAESNVAIRVTMAAYNDSFDVAGWGFLLDDEERRRRWIILSLLADGIDLDTYLQRFGTEALDDLPELRELTARGLAEDRGRRMILTERGLERSDAIGPWLHSERVRELMRSAELR
jgi:hypothetical protein